MREVLVCRLKALRLKVTAYKGFNQPRARYIFLEHRVEPIEALLHGSEKGLQFCAEKVYHDAARNENRHHREG